MDGARRTALRLARSGAARSARVESGGGVLPRGKRSSARMFSARRLLTTTSLLDVVPPRSPPPPRHVAPPTSALACRSVPRPSHFSRIAGMQGEGEEGAAPAATSARHGIGEGEKASWRTLENLNFDNLALRSLPIDPVQENYPRKVPNACFSRVQPTPVLRPFTVVHSPSALALIDLSPDQTTRPEFAEYLSGNRVLPGAEPAAHCYCGHQFGYFSGQLGDGATMYLGEIVNSKGDRWEIQFKGAGKTPYSRTADGRKVLRSSLREFLCSEAMYHLGVPTTRAGTVVSSDTRVVRDIFYNGNPINERATIILRIAPTFLRFGSFEIFKPTDPQTGREGPSAGNRALLIQLLEYIISTHYPDIAAHEDPTTRYIAFYSEVVRRTARLVAEWQCVGWCHGVLNTDNMSIVGVTIDYGPFGFLDAYDPEFICNGSDDGGRYSYRNQPDICYWNLRKLSEAIKLAVPVNKTAPELAKFHSEYQRHYNAKMRCKLGLIEKDMEKEDEFLVTSLLETMQGSASDWTNTFRYLSSIPIPISREESDNDMADVVESLIRLGMSPELLAKKSSPTIPLETLKMMLAVARQNPAMLQLFGMTPEKLVRELKRAGLREEGDSSEAKEETDKPVDKHTKDRESWTAWLRSYRARLWQEVEGKSAEEIASVSRRRVEVMSRNNPKFILRNYIAQRAIKAAEDGDLSEVQRVYRLLCDPYGEGDEFAEYHYDALPPEWAAELCVT